MLLMGGCQCFVPVTEDSGVELDGGAVIVDADGDAGVVDEGVDAGPDGGADSGLIDAGIIDAGAPDGGVDSGVHPSCATVRCSPWTTCFEDAGAVCVPTVIALRWVVPASDAAVPIDTIRLAVAIEVMGVAEASIPVMASGAGQGTTVATRSDAGLALGSLSFTTLDAGRLLLSAGWSGGPQTTAVVNVLPTRAIEIVGANPPSHGVNTVDFEPNDPEGNAWRRDDVVPFRSWPGAQVIARHDRPDASAAIIDAGRSCDGGCSSFRLQDVEFNAFRGEVELGVVSDAGWEARGERLTVTRWRWRRVVAGVPNPIKVQTPVMTICSSAPWAACIVVGTEDTRSTGRLVALDEEGVPVPSWFPQGWADAVTAPVDACSQIIAGFDGDAGYLWGWAGQGLNAPGERYTLLGGGTDRSVAVTDEATVVTGDFSSSRFVSGRCRFDGGAPATLVVADTGTVVTNSSGELCVVAAPAYPWHEDAGWTRMLSERAFPSAAIGGSSWPSVVTIDGRLSTVETFPSRTDVRALFDAGAVDSLVMGIDWFLFTQSPALIRATPDNRFVGASALPSRVVSPPVFRPLAEPSYPLEGLLYAVGQDQRLTVIATVSLSELWGWAPDGGLSPSAPLGFAPSYNRLGSLLVAVRGAVLSIVADGLPSTHLQGWTQAGGDPSNCGTNAANRAVFR